MNLLQRAFVATHTWLLRTTGGRIGSRLAGIEHLVLETLGRRSGHWRSSPLACFEIEGKLLVVASKGGSDTDPAWYANLAASPEVRIVRRGTTETRQARTASPDERARLWPELVARNRAYGHYARQTSREIPVVVLEPSRSEAPR